MNTTKVIGTAVLVLTGGLAVVYPQYKVELISITTLLFGWLHLPQPGSKA